MKKLLSFFCCVLFVHAIARAPFDMRVNAQKTSGERVLVKALAVIVNREGNKKAPIKRIEIPAPESPFA